MTLLLSNAACVFGMMFLLWLVSIPKRDVSIVDPFWSIAFLLVGANTALHSVLTSGKLLLLSCLALWSLRLWAHLWWRSRGQPEDPRYAAFRARFGAERYWWFSLFQVFGLQGALALLISAPLMVALSAEAPDPIGALDVLGTAVFAIGFGFEVVADQQLARFRRDPSQRGAVMDRGLWRYSRHPNYFGEAVLWWGFWMQALNTPYGLPCVVAPLLMSFLLLRVSGVTLLDAHLKKTRPAYADYIARTSAFWPRRPH
ncbi:MAG: DUF1295 domain-containing protein [Myxococcota bacterium]